MINKTNQKGYTMIETIMYVSLLIILGASLASYMHKAMQRYKIGRAAQQVIDLKKAIVYFTAGDEDYTRLTIEAMDNNRSLPMDMRTGDHHTAKHALGGKVELGPVTELDAEPNENSKFMFYITFKNLPQSACAEILTQGQFYGDGSEMDTLIVNDKEAWRFEYSFFDVTDIATVHTLALPEERTFSNAPQINVSLMESIRTCSKRNDNKITWIFS